MAIASKESRQAVRINPTPYFVRIRGFKDTAIRMKNTHAGQALIAADHLKDSLNIPGLTTTHRIVNGPFNDRYHQICGTQA